MSAGSSSLSFGLTSNINPLAANFADGLLNYLCSKMEGQIPSTNDIDKQTLDLIAKIIAELE